MSDGRLLRVLGVGFGLAVIIGNTIGAGIFRAPGQVAAHLPDPGLFLAAWAAGGLYALIGAIQIAELGTMLPRSGGQYVFSRYALGEYAGFLVGWSDWISTCGTTAAVTVVIAESSPELLPVFGGSVPALAGTVAVVVCRRTVARHPPGESDSERHQRPQGRGLRGVDHRGVRGRRDRRRGRRGGAVCWPRASHWPPHSCSPFKA